MHDNTRTLTCKVCGSEFEATPHQAEYRSCCSEECGHKLQSQKVSGKSNSNYTPRVELECEVCECTFEIRETISEYRKTCSRDCESVWQSRQFSDSGNPNFNSSVSTKELVRLYKSGKPAYSIAEKVDMTDVGILKRLANSDVSLRNGGWPKEVETERGEMVISYYEQQVADWLFERGVEYEYEPDGFGKWTPDFVVDGVVIEVWGVKGSPEYDDRRQRKESWYSRQDINCTGVEPEDIGDLNDKLRRFL